MSMVSELTNDKLLGVTWLETTAAKVRARQWHDIDVAQLLEYLTIMAKNDQHEVVSRFAVLIAHILKWEFQPGMQSSSWKNTIETQQEDLEETMSQGALRNHAVEQLPKAYRKACKLASKDTFLPIGAFPSDCPYTVEYLLQYVPKELAEDKEDIDDEE